MILLYIVLPIIFIQYQTANDLFDPAPIVFGQIRGDVTIHSRVENITSSSDTHVVWYHQRPGGKVENVAYFNSNAAQFKRYTGAFSKDSNYASLTISDAKPNDSGRYFAVVGAFTTFTPGLVSILVITDPENIPVLRVFRSRAGTFLCELKGGGPDWNDPQWGTEDGEGRPRLLQPEVERFLDEQGTFIRSSILTVDDGFRVLNCASQHSTGVIIRTQLYSEGHCPWLWYVSLLCVLLLLVTVTAGGLWARRLRTQTHTTQGMDSNGGT